MKSIAKTLLVALSGVVTFAPGLGALAEPANTAAAAPAGAASRERSQSEIFAKVGDVTINAEELRAELLAATRQKYYHGRPPDAELANFERGVGETIINRVLLHKEAQRRGITPDRKKVKQALAGFEARYGKSAAWKENGKRLLTSMAKRLETQSMIERLEHVVRKVPAPTAQEARSYYTAHRDKFVEPEQLKLSLILLRVDPSAGQAAWDGALAEGGKIHERLKRGADFAELARLHSADPSAQKGGDMGYVHRGMIPEAVQQGLDKLKRGEISAPVVVLEGVAIVRLDERKAARQRTFEEVRARAGELWQREQAEARWQRLIADLRKATVISVDESFYTRLPPEKKGAS